MKGLVIGMKKILLLLAAAALLMTSCAPDSHLNTNGAQNGTPSTENGAGTADNGGMNGTDGNNAASGDPDSGVNNGADNGMNGGEAGTGSLRRSMGRQRGYDDMSDTLGDRDGDGYVENALIDGPDTEIGAVSYRPVKRVKTAEDARNFIGSNLLSRCALSLPGMSEVRILEDDERDSLADKAGLTDADGVRDVVVAQASGDDEDFSVVMLRTDGSHTTALSHELGKRIDAAKLHACPAGERTVSVTLDDDVILLSGDKAEVAAALQALVRAADGVYGHVGSARVIETA